MIKDTVYQGNLNPLPAYTVRSNEKRNKEMTASAFTYCPLLFTSFEVGQLRTDNGE